MVSGCNFGANGVDNMETMDEVDWKSQINPNDVKYYLESYPTNENELHVFMQLSFCF
jgi:hypothetical protein